MIAFSVLCDGAIRLTEYVIHFSSQCRRVRFQTEKTGVSMKNQHKKGG